LKSDLSYKKDEKSTLKDQIKQLKSEYEKLKNSHGDKRTKLENKSKMFLGLLKH